MRVAFCYGMCQIYSNNVQYIIKLLDYLQFLNLYLNTSISITFNIWTWYITFTQPEFWALLTVYGTTISQSFFPVLPLSFEARSSSLHSWESFTGGIKSVRPLLCPRPSVCKCVCQRLYVVCGLIGLLVSHAVHYNGALLACQQGMCLIGSMSSARLSPMTVDFNVITLISLPSFI